MIYSSNPFSKRTFLEFDDGTPVVMDLLPADQGINYDRKLYSVTATTRSSTDSRIEIYFNPPDPEGYFQFIDYSSHCSTVIVPARAGYINNIDVDPPVEMDLGDPSPVFDVLAGFYPSLKRLNDENGNQYLLVPSGWNISARLKAGVTNASNTVSVIAFGEY